MIATIHQPNYLPWIGYFSKIKHADCFVSLDNVKYTKNSLINRNKIRTKESWCYITIPVEKRYYDSKICEVNLPKDNCWMEKHWKTIETNYQKSEYFNSYKDFFEIVYKNNFGHLWEINEKIILYLLNCFDINVEIIKASNLNIERELHKSDLLVAVLESIGAGEYLSGPSGKNYLEIDKFKEKNIKVEFFEFKHPIYKQRYQGFEPNMAAIDLLFNVGDKARDFI